MKHWLLVSIDFGFMNHLREFSNNVLDDPVLVVSCSGWFRKPKYIEF